MANKKIPKNNPISIDKKPKQIVAPNSYYSKTPSWKFSKMDIGHIKWSFIKNDCFSKMDIIKRLSDFEKQQWKDIIGERNHFIEIHHLTKEAQNRLTELGLHYESIFSLTINSRERIFGIMDDGALFLLWYDEKHEICPSHKKHT